MKFSQIDLTDSIKTINAFVFNKYSNLPNFLLIIFFIIASTPNIILVLPSQYDLVPYTPSFEEITIFQFLIRFLINIYLYTKLVNF